MYLSDVKMSEKLFRGFLGIALLVPVVSYAENFEGSEFLIFSTPPTQSVETTKKNYQPLVDYISDAINQKIILRPAKNFVEYSKNLRENKYDMVFDGPHFVNWRIRKQNHVVVAKQVGELHFTIIVNKKSSIISLEDLWTLPVCTPSVPHLGTLTLLEIYSNPIREPIIVPVQSFKHALTCLREGRGVAALVRDKYWYKKADKSGLRVIHTTKRKMPARALTVGQRIDKIARRQIMMALTSKQGQEYAEKAFSTIGGGKFVRAKTGEFSGLGEIINQVWGFHLR